MKFINDIDLSVASDVRGKEIQENSDTLELSMAVLLGKIFDRVTTYSPRQDILDSFSVYNATAFENYNVYRDALYAINPGSSAGGLSFPDRFPITPVQSTVELTKDLARTVEVNRRQAGEGVNSSEGSGLSEIDITKTPYESYIKNADGTMLYYSWNVVTLRPSGAFLRYEDIIYG
jgi:hypothetical protein